MRIIILLTVLFLFSSCSSNYYMKKGNKLFETGRYYKAVTRYEKAYDKISKPEAKASVAMRIGQAYQDINKVSDAYSWYRKASRGNKLLKEAYLKMAEVSIGRGDLEAADDMYARFSELFPDDERGMEGTDAVSILKEHLPQEGRYTIQLVKELNSRDNDFAPAYYPADNSIVYYTSTRPLTGKKRKKTDPVTGDNYSQIFVSEYTQEVRKTDREGVVKVVRHYPEPRWMPSIPISDSLRSTRNDGVLCFTADGNTIYFTSSRPVDGKYTGTKIYMSALESTGDVAEGSSWKKVNKSGICGDSISVGHPAITPDGLKMYFVTDQLPGGKGGKDIWYMESEGGIWGEPQNAGDLINTEGDEMFPYVRENGELYFASNGHEEGIGGLDIYKIVEEEGEFRRIHLPAPINSLADDFGITFKNGQEEGLFSSSRSNRTDNIYAFSYIRQQLALKILVRNSVTERPIPTMVISGVSDDGTRYDLISDSTGQAIMTLLPDQEYVFTTEHPDYLRGKAEVSTYREKDDRIYEVVIDMQPIEKPIVIPNIYFDVAKWDLREDAMRNLKELITIMEDNPNITIELSAHTDMVGNAAANMLLSERRASAVVDYLIAQGIYWDRMVAKGYGKNRPREMNEREARGYDFLKEGDILNERFIARLNSAQREVALQLNRRIEFKVLRTDYKPGPNSHINPEAKAVSAEETDRIGEVKLRDIRNVEGKFYTLQLGVFKNVPAFIHNFKVIFTEKLDNGTVRYCVGIYETRTEADNAARELRKKGMECVVKEYDNS